MSVERISRRAFLGSAAALALSTRTYAQPNTPRNLRIESGKSVLQPGDFQYLGAFQVPIVPPFDSGWGRGLTHRYVGQELRFYFNQFRKDGIGGNYQVVEASAPPELKTVAPYSAPGVYGALGSASGTLTVDGAPQALYWDAIGERLYWVAYNDYGGDGAPQTLGYCTFATEAGRVSTMQTHGIWRVAAAEEGGARWHKAMTGIPQWFADAYCGGRRLGLTGGGIMSRVAVGPVSVGPALKAARPIDSRDANGVYRGGLVSMIVHPFHSEFGPPYRARRGHTAYFSHLGYHAEWNPRNGVGYWVNSDSIDGGLCWIETPTKHGFLVLASMMEGGNALQSRVLSAPAPTKRTFAVSRSEDFRLGDLILIWNGVHRPDIHANHSGNGSFSNEDIGVPFHHPCVLEGTELDGFRSQAYGQLGVVESIDRGVITLREELAAVPIVGGPVALGEFYVDGGVPCSRKRPYWYMYDPEELARAARGEKTSDLTDWSWFRTQDKIGSAVPESIWTIDITGATYDATTQRLYLLNGGRVLVYAVS